MKRFLLAISVTVDSNRQVLTTGISSILIHIFHKNLKPLVAFFALCMVTTINAQQTEQQQADYIKTITERSDKIVRTLEIKDSAIYKKVLNEVMNQYFNLNKIHEGNKEAVAAIKQQGLSKEETDEAVKKQEEKKMAQLLQLHGEYIAQLKENLTEAQVEKIKDGMTYSVLKVTWTAYQDMLPNLTEEQKTKIYAWLVEARELAMDAESSEKKHAVFGKYKGRINNYLSAAGIDMKKEEAAWQERIKERKKNQGTNSR